MNLKQNKEASTFNILTWVIIGKIWFEWCRTLVEWSFQFLYHFVGSILDGIDAPLEEDFCHHEHGENTDQQHGYLHSLKQIKILICYLELAHGFSYAIWLVKNEVQIATYLNSLSPIGFSASFRTRCVSIGIDCRATRNTLYDVCCGVGGATCGTTHLGKHRSLVVCSAIFYALLQCHCVLFERVWLLLSLIVMGKCAKNAVVYS